MPSTTSAVCVKRASSAPLILALGDSLTAGGGGNIAPYIAQMMGLLTPGSYRMVNLGVGGTTASQIHTSWTTTGRAMKAPHVFVMGGINDIRVGTTAATVWPDLKAIVDEAVADGAIVHLGNVTPFNNYASSWTAGKETERLSLNATIAAYCNGTTIKCMDLDAAVRDPGQTNRILPGFDTGDNIHPNVWGTKAMATTARATLP